MKINSRSPYYINHTISSSDIAGVKLNLWIYTGTQTTSRPTEATYTLESTPVNSEVTFEISDLVKDYFELSHNSTQILWVDYRIDEGTAEDYYRAYFDGTYGEDKQYLTYLSDDNGGTPKIGTTIMIFKDYSRPHINDDTIYYYDANGTSLKMTLDVNGVLQSIVSEAGAVTPYADRDIRLYGQTIAYTIGSTTVQLEGFYGYTYFEDGVNAQNDKPILLSSNYVIKNKDIDYRVPVNNNYGTFTANVFDDDNNLLGTISDSATTNSSNVVSYYEEGDTVNKIVVGSDTYYILTECETKHTPYKVTFINKYGVLEDVWFFKNSKLDINIEQEGFKRNIISSGSYSINDHQYHTLRKQGRETITLNSGFYPEASNETFRQLLLSDYLWLHYNSQVLPVQVKDSSFNFKTRLTDRVINYTMQFEFAFDKLNNVR